MTKVHEREERCTYIDTCAGSDARGAPASPAS